MAFASTSTSQFHPTALHSLAKLQPSCPLLLLLRSHSSLPPRGPRLFAPILGLTPPPHITPVTTSYPPPRWIDKWRRTHFRKLLKRPRAVVDYRGSGVSDDDEEFGTSRSTGSSTMEKIVEKLKRFGYVDDVEDRKEAGLPEKGSVEDIFYVEDGVLPNSRGGLSSDSGEEVRFPWEKPREEAGVGSARRKASKSSLAELTLPEGELRRLRHMAIRTKSKTKIGGAGVTKEIVDKIHVKWQTEEVVRLKCEGPPALNMKRMHEILERRTGGLVIWRSGSSISLYRGVSYELPQPVSSRGTHFTRLGSTNKVVYKRIGYPSENVNDDNTKALPEGDASYPKKIDDNRSPTDLKYEHEVDSLLDGLGPRYTDWPGCDPFPVDADLLPGYLPGYKPPFRILPYGVRRSLGMKDQTGLRRLARVLPPHFALGRSRQHQGLAAAMVKLWEKSSIAKIALKRGVQLTTSERMAEDIKKLTGGTLLCRNKDYIVFYRGKDFLAPEVTEALLERERLAKALQDVEEQARAKASFSIFSNTLTVEESGTAGTLTETQEAGARWGKRFDSNDKDKMVRTAEIARHANLVRKLERKLFLAEKKLAKAERALGKVEEFLEPTEQKPDPESISDEERFMFRKLGLKMKAFLLLGRRGVFDGTVENMHLHWKYRELVKIIVKAKTFAQVRNVALSLEAESGGVLVSVDKVSKGFAIIVYRGKDYQRPRSLRPKNLLTKRKALARSIELQRRETLNGHISNMHKRVKKLRSELDQMETVKEHGDEELYAKLDSTYSSGDEDTEDEGDGAYLETFESVIDDDGNDDDNGDDDGNEDITSESAIDDDDDDDINNDDAKDDDEAGTNDLDDKEDSGDNFHSVVNSYNHHISLSSSNSESSVLYNSHSYTIHNSESEEMKA